MTPDELTSATTKSGQDNNCLVQLKIARNAPRLLGFAN